MLHLNTIEGHTLVLLKKLQQLEEFSGLRLVGGTALALQLGHRQSIDLDFFGSIEADTLTILDLLKSHKLEDIAIESQSPRIHIFRINGIKVDIINYPYKWLAEPIEEERLKLAALNDIAAMKLEAISNRGTKKDFIDLYFLLKTFQLPQMLDFYTEKYPHGSIYNVVRSLTYFTDADPQVNPRMIKRIQWDEVKETIKQAVREL